MPVKSLLHCKTIHVLLLEDNATEAELCIQRLRSAGFDVAVEVARVSREFMEYISSRGYDVILAECRLPDWTGLEALHWLRSAGYDTPLILLTGFLEDEFALECIRAGANDCVLKANLDRLPVAVQRAIDEQRLRLANFRAEWKLLESEKQYRRAEAELRDNRERLQLLLDSTAEAIYGLDMEGICTFCNAACLQMLAYDSTRALLGKKMHTLVHHTQADGRTYPEKDCPILKAFRMDVPYRSAAEVFWRADGSSFPVEYWSYPMHRDQQVVGCVVTFFDISERLQAEECIRRSEAQFRSIVEGAPYGIYRVDMSGQVTMANPALMTMLGYASQGEMVGLNAATAIYCDAPQHGGAVSDVDLVSTSARQETRWKRKDGTIITVRLAGRRLTNEQNDPLGFEVFVEDITEQRSLQKQFEHAQKMEAVGRLASGVAHDFNNLLMVIDSYAQLLEQSPSDPEKVLQYAKKIQEADSRAASVARQLLAFSRKQVQEPTVFDLNHVVRDLRRTLTRLLGEAVEIVMALEPHPARVCADRGQIEQVIMNLAVNARDAMPNGGRLGIETSNVQLDARYSQHRGIDIPPADYVMLAVSDTGTGMDAETQAHIFEPFFTTKEAGKGTGLGLATVYGFVKHNRGFVWVYSEMRRGSIFRVYLPAVDAPVPEMDSPVVETALGGTETILLVEDEATLREVSRVYLESKGYTILEARNATDAMKTCRTYKGPIQVLFTDLVTPGSGGLELARAALAVRPGLRVLLASGHTDRTLDSEAIRTLGTFLQKPFSLDSLARKIRSVVDERRGMAEAG